MGMNLVCHFKRRTQVDIVEELGGEEDTWG
jgi:hypothetical protein